jgi:hypothetical protein
VGTREEAQQVAGEIYAYLRDFSVDIHVGTPEVKSSKSMVLFVPASEKMKEVKNCASLFLNPEETIFLDFKREVIYLGHTITDNLLDDRHLQIRMRKAASVFGALRKCLLGSKHAWKSVKSKVMTTMVLPTMLDGVESCVITAQILQEMTSKYHQWIRSCCRITPYTQRKNRITSEDLLRQMGLQPLHYYIDLKQLSYAGHIQRMATDRLPKTMRDGHLAGPRKLGRPHKNLNACIMEGLKRKGVSSETWQKLAEDKTNWRQAIRKQSCGQARWKARQRHPSHFNKWSAQPRSIIGQYVEKRFGSKWYTGIITDVDIDIDTNQTIWRIVYDDDDEADYNENQLNRILCLDMKNIIEPV